MLPDNIDLQLLEAGAGHCMRLTLLLFLREGKTSGHSVCLLTLKGDFTLSGSSAEDMAELITMFLSGLTERSKQPIKDVNRQVMSRNSAPERLWAHSREPIRQPLLKNLVGNPELSHKACLAFNDILCTAEKMATVGYNYPTRQMQSPLELTDQIFSPPAKHEALRDEIYCQIMKQMTSNNNRFSIEQGWQLLWLCCGLFPPSQSLLRHAQKFLESRRREPLASDCLQRLQSSLRKLPPHQVEVDAIQQNSTQIFHKIYFPNDTDEVRTELPKYLRGYHVCTKEEMVNIAALLFRVKVNGDKNQIAMIPKVLKELIPGDQLKAMSENEWKKVQILRGWGWQEFCGLCFLID
ncbi:hypothetical protein GOODEAATRI_010668 [Goodea atripinnis]|uniref:MyTH4 domain-containing protein n=1 Tax=Goodea atripinnis TaxID=208336 RepID=A0ABV0PMG1_9TELE